MEINYLVDAGGVGNITPLFVGWDACKPGHSFGPYIRDCYLIHFCLGGRGILKNRHGIQNIEAGSFFVIRPGEVTTYAADKDDPWEYTWIAFRSQRVETLEGERTVFDTPDGLDTRLLSLVKEGSGSPEGFLSIIYELIHRALSGDRAEIGDERIRKIHRYIKYNYMLPLRVGELADKFGFDRSYLYRAFKKRYGIGIKKYIIRVRMEMGKMLLTEGYSVKESAHMVGYDDEFNFSKAYKTHFGYSPSRIKE